MSTNRQKTTKRLSLRKKSSTKIAKSPRRSQPSLGLVHNHHPVPLTLNATSIQTKSPRQNMSRSKSTIILKKQSAAKSTIPNITSIKPKINKNWTSASASPSSQSHSRSHSYSHNISIGDNMTDLDIDIIDDDDDDDDSMSNLLENKSMLPPNVNVIASLSGSSIRDILGPMSSVHEDSDDEEATKAMLTRLYRLNLPHTQTHQNKLRKIQSNPAISTMSNSLCVRHHPPSYPHTYIENSTAQRNDTSPSSVSTNTSNTDIDDNNINNIIFKSVAIPESNAILKNQDGLLTYVGQDAQCINNNSIASHLPRVKSVNYLKNTSPSLSHHYPRSLSTLSTSKSKRKRQLQKQKRVHVQQLPLGCNKDKIAIPSDNRAIKKGRCEIPLQSEWDCLTVSTDQQWVALFSRNSMALLKITPYGSFEQLRDLKARGRKESRLKYGAVDAQFYYGDPSKLISCTRSGTLSVLNLNLKGRGCIALTNCPLKQRVHKVTWIKNTQNVLCGAEDGKCYLWDTRIEGRLDSNFRGGKSFNKSSSALSVKISPFNDNLFASSHKNGTVNIWDIRNEKCPFLTITAHKSSINCIDWHPAIPNVIASCGYRDITIKIWNLTDDKVAQQKYYDYWTEMSQHSHRNYNYEDDYRLSVSDMYSSPSYTYEGYKAVSFLEPECSMYPSAHVSQIGWRPCKDPQSLSANQIACCYVGSQQVVEMWDIKSSYVPVARLSSHESETKFKFILKDKPFRNYDDMVDDLVDSNKKRQHNDMRTYLITCSKDKTARLTDCGFADIPRSHLSSCALDVAPFGNSCFVSVPRQKLHPFDQETYTNKYGKNNGEPATLPKAASMGALCADNIQRLKLGIKDLSHLRLKTPTSEKMVKKRRSLSGNINTFGLRLNKLNGKNDNLIASDSECIPSSSRVGIFGIFQKKKIPKRSDNKKKKENENKNEENESERKEVNAMSGLHTCKLMQLTDIFNHNFDAFSEFETKLTCYPLSTSESDISDSSVTFKYLAKHYKLSGKSIPWICLQNAKIAQNIANNELTHLWNLLAILLKNILSPKEKAHINKTQKICYKNINLIDDEESDDDDHDWWMAKNNNNSSSASNSYLSLNSSDSSNNSYICTPPLKILENAFVNDDEYAFINEEEDKEESRMVTNYIRDVLYENIDRGDIQTAVTIIIMLNEYICQYLQQDMIADIILSYLDLLLHSKLLIEAVKIYQLTKHYESVGKYFLCQHRLIIKCIRCKETMRNHRCFKCNKIARCSICNQPLLNINNNNQNDYAKLKHPKLLIWCQICGHGGHFDHIKDWFINKIICSVDSCSHQCQPVLISCDSNNKTH